MVFIIDKFFHLNLYVYGIFPRELFGIKGVLFSPLIHSSYLHLANNIGTLFIGKILLYYFYEKVALSIIIITWIIGGTLVWIFGNGNSYHIGASGLIYGILGFLLFSGLFRKDTGSIALSLLVLTLNAGFFEGFVPKEGISWQSHLFGALSGAVLSLLYKSIDNPQIEKRPNKILSKFFKGDEFELTKVERRNKEIIY